MPDSSHSVSGILDYIKYIIKKHETLTVIPTIHVYINRINNRLMFKIKGGYRLELQTAKTIKLFGSTKKINRENKNEEKVPSLPVIEVVLVQFNLLDNPYQQTPNKSYVYLFNVEPNNLVFLKTYNNEFDEIITTFTDQNGRPLEIED